MLGRKPFEYNHIRYPLTWVGPRGDLGQHVRLIREPYFVRTSIDAVANTLRITNWLNS